MKKKLVSVSYCVVQAIVGVLILLDPVAFTSGILIALGIILTVAGIVGIVQYFKKPIVEASKEQLLSKGLLAMLVGLFGIFKSGWLIATFPIITIIYGILMLIIGISKIQVTADNIRKKQEKWYLGIISAVLTLACACIVILNPFSSTAILWMFTGIAIVVDAAFDMVALFFIKEPAKEEPAEAE